MRHAFAGPLQGQHAQVSRSLQDLLSATMSALQAQQDRTARAGLRLGLLDPSLVLKRGYAWLTNEEGLTVAAVEQVHRGERVRATLSNGVVDLSVVGKVSV